MDKLLEKKSSKLNLILFSLYDNATTSHLRELHLKEHT